MERCQEMSHVTPTTALVAAITTAATYHGRPAPRATGRVEGMTAAVSCLAVAGASRDETFPAPLLENLLGLLMRLVQRLLRAHPSRRRVGEHGRQDERVENLTLRRVGGSRVSDVCRPLQRGADRLELRRWIRAEWVVRRGLLEPLVSRRWLLRHRHAGVGDGPGEGGEVVQLAPEDGVAVVAEQVEQELPRHVGALRELPDHIDPHHVLARPARPPRALERRNEEDVV